MLTWRYILSSIGIQILIFGSLLFIPAGTLHWWRAWVVLALAAIGTAATLLLVFPGREDLLRERMKPFIQEGQPLTDRILVLLFVAGCFGIFVLAPLDVFHFHLLPHPRLWASTLGLVLFIAGWWIISLVFKENRFAAPVVKYQEERQQHVIDTGVYHIVRHPMYTGVSIWMVGLALWLESTATAWFAVIPIALLMLRILFEERFLKRELAGYTDYTHRVRYRLIPFIW